MSSCKSRTAMTEVPVCLYLADMAFDALND